MNCVPTMPARKPTTVFASPPMPMTPRRQRVLREPGDVPASRPADRAGGQAHVDDDDQHEVDARRSAHEEPRQRRLQHQRDGDDDEDLEEPHRMTPPEACAGAGAPLAPAPVLSDASGRRSRGLGRRGSASTTSTSSRPEKFTAGRTRIVLNVPPARSTVSMRPDDEPLRVDAVDAGRHDDVAVLHVGRRRARTPGAAAARRRRRRRPARATARPSPPRPRCGR